MSTNLLVKLPVTNSEAVIRRDWFEERDRLIAEEAFFESVSNSQDFESASELLRRMTKLSLNLEKLRKEIARPFQEASKLIKRAAESAAAPLEESRERLKAALNSFAAAQKSQERRQESDFRESCERMLGEHARLQELAFSELGSEAEIFIPDLPAPPCPTLIYPETVSIKSRLSFEISDETLLPRDFFSVDERKIRAWVSEHRDELRMRLEKEPGFASKAVPGLVLKLETEVVSR